MGEDGEACECRRCRVWPHRSHACCRNYCTDSAPTFVNLRQCHSLQPSPCAPTPDPQVSDFGLPCTDRVSQRRRLELPQQLYRTATIRPSEPIQQSGSAFLEPIRKTIADLGRSMQRHGAFRSKCREKSGQSRQMHSYSFETARDFCLFR